MTGGENPVVSDSVGPATAGQPQATAERLALVFGSTVIVKPFKMPFRKSVGYRK